MDLVRLVPRGRLRFYDQTGCSLVKLLHQARREIRGEEAPAVPKLSASASKHYTFFGVTSLDTSLPALAWKVYPADAENKQDGLDHIDFFLALISAGYIYPYDVIVMDNWTGHTGAAGQQLEKFMKDKYGVTFLHLGARLSHQNPVEHIWRKVKAAAVRTVQDYLGWGYLQVPELMGREMDKIDHLDVLKVMEGDGYEVETDLRTHIIETYQDILTPVSLAPPSQSP